MEVFHLFWDLFAPRIWDCSTTRLTYITERKDIIDLLKKGTEELISISEDVKVRLQVAEQQGLVLRVQVTGWLKNVETVEVEVNEILQQAEALDEKWPSPRMYRSAYKLGKKASKTLNTVKELITKGEFQEVAIKPVQSLDQVVSTQMEGFCVMPMENTVGMESILSTVLKHLQDDTIGIIGLFGMGGVGKTTLLKRINNQLLGWHHVIFDAAIWVVASKLATVEAIQQSILEKLEIPFETWRNKPMSVKSALLYQILSVKKYILLLDDVWESLDLSEVGIPLPNNINKCKLIFSTRSEEICGLMGAQLKIRVACLPWKKSWDLFQEKVGRATLDSHYEIQGLAIKVAEQCDGLPLALITVGRAMASRKTPNEWSHALRVLRNYPDRFPRMGEHVLPIMKFSYDSLPCPIMKECFLYCSLFPEDIEIPINKLVNLWLGEGYLNKFGDISEARNHGFYIIESLKLACLLEGGSRSYRVKMHDVIRDMALWIVSDYGDCYKKFFILEKNESIGISIQHKDNVEKMSLSGCMVPDLILYFKCPQLSTLVVNDTNLERIPSLLFDFIPLVRVLDLSSNKKLSELPEEISKLRCIEYLDLSRTALKKLPVKLKDLGTLRYLLMNYMEELKEYPTNIICGLPNLWVFRMNYGPSDHQLLEFLKALDNLDQLNETSIYVQSELTFLLNSKNLLSSARYLRLNVIDSELISLSHRKARSLEALQIYDSKLRTLKLSNPTMDDYWNLQHVIISRCKYLQDLDCLVYAPFLKNIWVSQCRVLQRITRIDNMDANRRLHVNVFSSLKRIRLDDLPCLEYICNIPLRFPSLERIYISKCPKLLELPFTDVSAKNCLQLIKGHQHWWNELRWRDDNLRQHFFPYFRKWTLPRVGLPLHNPLLVSSGNWPESKSNIPSHFLSTSRLHILRASMNIWEE